MNTVIIENKRFSLILGENGCALSLIDRASGEECLANSFTPAFEVTQTRPFNNEIKLSHPNKRTAFRANRIVRDGDRLTVGFEIIPYTAHIDLDVHDDYIGFTLAGFECPPEGYAGLSMDSPPVAEMRILALAVKERGRFGEWLNVAFDERVAVNLLASSPEARIDSDRRDGYRLMTADAVRGIRLVGCKVALIVCPTDELLDCIDRFERDHDLPLGVEERRGENINRSIYWSSDVNPNNVDEHIARAKQGGFGLMLLYYSCPFKSRGFITCGDYDFRDEYPKGIESLREMLEKIRAAGIIPGLHFLHTHIGLESRYVTPKADYRLNLTEKFTLARPLDESPDTTELFVEESPEFAVRFEKCRVLKFGTELIGYDDFTTERPYKFTGIKRGHLNTDICAHPLGERGGILDISEYCAVSCYLDQNSDLQEEIAEKLAAAYNAGFEFVYFDGSEGTNPPFEYHVPNAQYRVWKHFDRAPLFGEGAAKSHFSWHMISGGNAFDVFPMSIFKEKLDEFPVEEAPRMRNDFTRVNFGWWRYDNETMPDIYEYGTSKAAAFDCPATMQTNLAAFKSNPRTADTLEVMRRWEVARSERLLSQSEKLEMQTPGREFTLLRESDGSLKLYEYHRVKTEGEITAYTFTRDGRGCAMLWHRKGEGELKLALDAGKARAYRELDGEPIELGCRLTVSDRCVIETELSEAELAKLIREAR